MKRLGNMHLKWKIFGFLLGFCGLLLMILWLLQTVFLNDTYKWIRRLEMKTAIATVEQNVNSDDLQSVLDALSQQKAITVSPAEEFRQQPGPGGGVNSPGSGSKMDKKDKPRQETLTETRQFTKPDGTMLELTFHAMITPVDATVATLRIQLMFITGIMIVLSVLLALLLAHHVARPIEDVNRSAKSLAKGQYDEEFQGTGFLEIRELSDTLNKAAEELSKVEGFRRELLTNIAHDLRTPLSLIYSYAEMMHDFPDEIQPEQTRIIMEEAGRLSGLVNDVFEISKIESGINTANKTRWNLTGAIESILDRVEAMVKKDGYSFQFTYDKEVEVMADEVKIGQVIYNLLINAIHYTGENKNIQVTQAGDGEFVEVRVTDFGEGISSEDLPYIWDRYYRVDKRHKRSVTGSGLGLSIVKGVMKLHDGSCGAESELGLGSSFWFRLPLH